MELRHAFHFDWYLFLRTSRACAWRDLSFRGAWALKLDIVHGSLKGRFHLGEGTKIVLRRSGWAGRCSNVSRSLRDSKREEFVELSVRTQEGTLGSKLLIWNVWHWLGKLEWMAFFLLAAKLVAGKIQWASTRSPAPVVQERIKRWKVAEA